MSTYLVTGGCGFIGSHLVDALLAVGHTVCALDDLSSGSLSNLPLAADLIVGDVTDPIAVEKAMKDIDGCFHLAAIASVVQANEAWLDCHHVNLGGTITIFEEAARRGGIPVVYASSAAVYGACPDVPLIETSAVQPLSAYGADKLGCELHARVAGRIHGLPTFGLRFFNVYGPRQNPSSPYSGVISIFVDRIRAGQPVTIHGDGEQMRDFVHCEDVVTALWRAMSYASVTAPVVNICSGRPVSINELVTQISEIIGQGIVVNHGRARDGDIRVSIGNPALSRECLDLPAPRSLREGLTAMLALDRIALEV